MALTYANYLKLDDLLVLQRPLAKEAHDEMLFIVIHQVYELWFKEILHELDRLRALLHDGDFTRAQFPLKRVLAILKVIVLQFDVLETMLPQEFLAFRNRLETASGFQSVQFRELEFLLGHKRRQVFDHLADDSPARESLEMRYRQPTLWDSLLAGLSRSGMAIPAGALRRDVTRPIEPCASLRRALGNIYRDSPRLVFLLELLLDLDQGFQEWRYRHVRMVERMIGGKTGTGGSAGVGYLQSTLGRPFFPDLWAMRTELPQP